jgi:hypothetical protein
MVIEPKTPRKYPYVDKKTRNNNSKIAMSIHSYDIIEIRINLNVYNVDM